jgi:hypothetical protein
VRRAYARAVRWWIRWDGRTLLLAQRPNVFVYFGVFASWLVFALAMTVPGAGAPWKALLVAMAVLMPLLVVSFRRTVRAGSSLEVQGFFRRRVIPASAVVALSASRQQRAVASRYGRGLMPFVMIRLHDRAGGAEALLEIDEAMLDERSWRALRDGLAGLPYGSDRLAGP